MCSPRKRPAIALFTAQGGQTVCVTSTTVFSLLSISPARQIHGAEESKNWRVAGVAGGAGRAGGGGAATYDEVR